MERAETVTCFMSRCDSYMDEDNSGKGGWNLELPCVDHLATCSFPFLLCSYVPLFGFELCLQEESIFTKLEC